MALTKVSYSMIKGDWANVLNFGATGDGVTDDADSIQAAIFSVSTNFNTGYGGTVFFPKAINNGLNFYLINSTIEVPPGVILVGEGIGNASNVSGSSVKVNFDGVGIRFIRRNPDSTLFFNGGMLNIAMIGSGVSSTTAQRLVEIGDSAQINTQNGAWNGFVRDCLFNNTNGYGVFSSNSQEWIIEHNMFRETNRAINFSTVPASSRVLNNTFINESATACDYAVNYEPGSLGGAAGFVFKNNYIIGFDYGVYVAGCKGLVVSDNVFESTKEYPIHVSTTTFSGTSLGLNESVLPSIDAHGNTFIASGSAGNPTNVIYLANARNCNIYGNYVFSPYSTLSEVLDVYEDAANICVDNNISYFSLQGNNSGTVPLFDVSNTILGKQYISSFEKEKTLAANVTSASALGLISVVLQNDSVTTLSTLTNGQEGQTVTIHSASANATVSIDGTPLVIPIYKSATYQYSSYYASWILISKSF